MNREEVLWRRGKFSLVKTYTQGWGNRDYEKFLVMHTEIGMLGNALWFLPEGRTPEQIVRAKVGTMRNGTSRRINTRRRKIAEMEERMRHLSEYDEVRPTRNKPNG